MIAGYSAFLSAAEQDRRDAFLGTARRLGTVEQNVEKDFWVCWTLASLFQDRPEHDPRLLFKGGTSLSKAYGLISRFSEDIDITVFRDDLGEGVTTEQLEVLSGRKRRDKLDAIKRACQDHVLGKMRAHLANQLHATLEQAGLPTERGRVEPDAEDPDGQSLLVWYPAATPQDGYVRPAIKIEAGARSALDPHQPALIRPYIADDLRQIDLNVPAVTTVAAERTFWDKVVIVHGLRRWFEKRGILRGGGHRISRHYYDLFELLKSPVGAAAISNAALGADCVRHAKMFFNSPDLDLDSAKSGSFALSPTSVMLADLERDYNAMSGMIFGSVPRFSDVRDRIAELEATINGF